MTRWIVTYRDLRNGQTDRLTQVAPDFSSAVHEAARKLLPHHEVIRCESVKTLTRALI